MVTLTYWYVQCPGDSDRYSIRERTKKEATRRLNEDCAHWETDDKPVKVTVEYHTAFDLMKEYTGEGGCYPEWQALQK